MWPSRAQDIFQKSFRKVLTPDFNGAKYVRLKKHKRISDLEIRSALTNRRSLMIPDVPSRKRVIDAIRWLGIEARTTGPAKGPFTVEYVISGES